MCILSERRQRNIARWQRGRCVNKWKQQIETTEKSNEKNKNNNCKASICYTRLSSSERYEKLIPLSSVLVTSALWRTRVSAIGFQLPTQAAAITVVRYCIRVAPDTGRK